MTLGMLVRADHRGLATLTGLMARCLCPERVLLVDMSRHSPTACHPELFPDRWGTVAYDELQTGSYDWAPFLDGVSCVYTAEIPYDFRLFDEARRRGVRTILHVMPELDPYVRQPDLPRPDVLALPTRWLADRYPADTPILPVPVEPFTAVPGDALVHVSSLAMRDRNGTRVVLDASKWLGCPVIVRGQAAPEWPRWHASVEVADLADPQCLFDGAALVAIPRRYGGLSLVIQEALAAGLPILIPESDPYAPWLPQEALLGSVEGRNLQTKGGLIPTIDVDPRDLAARVDQLLSKPDMLGRLGQASREWAAAHTWGQVRPAWDAVLGTVPV